MQPAFPLRVTDRSDRDPVMGDTPPGPEEDHPCKTDLFLITWQKHPDSFPFACMRASICCIELLLSDPRRKKVAQEKGRQEDGDSPGISRQSGFFW